MTKNIALPLLFVLLLTLFAMKVSSLEYNASGDRLYSKQQCIEDLNSIATAIRTTHPAPFDYINKSDFEYKLQAQILELKDQNTLRDFHWIARKLVATIGCGHTALNGQNEERKIADSLHFPIDTRFVGDRLYIVTENDHYTQLAAGTEIKSINGQPIKSMLSSMIERVSSDGLNDAYPRYYINREVDFFIENEFHYPEIYKLELTDNSIIEVRSGIAHRRSIANGIPDIENLLFKLDTDNDIALMTLRSFYYYRENYKTFESFVDKSMEQIKGNSINNLIIDIRSNGGGDPYCANHLLRHISKKPYQYFHESNMGYPDLKKEIQPYENAFTGHTYMIINGGCGSTSGHLSSLVKYNNTATLIGQISGATYKCHDSSGDITLPNTQLNLHIARFTFQTAVEGMTMSEGVAPDITIEKSLADWITGSDSVIDSTYHIIRNKTKQSLR